MARSKARKLADILSGGTALEDGVISASEVVGLGTAATTDATAYATAGQGTLAASALQPTGDGSGLTGIETNPFSPTTVSGASQTLDLGSNNFFDAGTATANSTITLSNPPTLHRFGYLYNSGSIAASSVGGVTESASATFDHGAINNYQEYGYISWDGKHAYGVKRSTSSSQNKFWQVTMSTPFDISTATVVYEPTSGGIQGYNGPVTIHLSTDGTKLYWNGEYTGNWQLYGTLSTAFDLSTAGSFGELPTNNSWHTAMDGLESGKAGAWAPHWSYDGTKYYSKNEGSKIIRMSTASTAFDITSLSYTSGDDFNVSSTARNPGGTVVGYSFGITFNQNGTKMYVLNDYIWEYSLSTAWDITTASYVALLQIPPDSLGNLFSCRSGRFNSTGDKFLGLRHNANELVSIDMVAGTVVTFPVAVSGDQTTNIPKNATVFYDLYTADGGTSYQILNEVVNNG
jgi:hypothetical protein